MMLRSTKRYDDKQGADAEALVSHGPESAQVPSVPAHTDVDICVPSRDGRYLAQYSRADG